MSTTMTPEQVLAFLAWVNQHEPRVEPSPVNVEVWGTAVGSFPGDVLKTVLLAHWARSDEKPTPALVRKLALGEVERRAAKTRALAGPARKAPRGRGWSVMAEPWFQAIREEARMGQCERFGLPHDGDGWTAADRPADPATTEGVLGRVA